jgi:hypothetical protein
MAAARVHKAWQIYISGVTNYDQIAQECGYGSRAAAWNALQREMERVISADVDEWRVKLTARYEALHAAIWLRGIGNPDAPDPDEDDDEETAKDKRRAKRPNLFAIDRLIEIERDLRKLHGVDVVPKAAVVEPIIREYQPGVLEAV